MFLVLLRVLGTFTHETKFDPFGSFGSFGYRTIVIGSLSELTVAKNNRPI